MSYAQRYGGHQFGMWAGQLGDGRAIMLGELLNSKSQRWELQLKGAGKTPYSRFADGLAVLRSSIREFLCSEAIHSLGIQTTRALCLVTTGKYVTRDMFYDGNPKDEPGAIVCRVAQSFLRFGSYQIHASRGKDDLGLVRMLADYAIRYHFPHLENLSKSDSLSFSTGEGDDSVVDLTSNKYADNMSVLGLTIDYGPFGFLDAFDPSFTPNTTDLPGRRHCFANQPDIDLWNIAQYGTKFMDEYQAIMTQKLGLPKYNKQLISDILKNMAVDKVDYTNFFRLLSNIKADPTIREDDLLTPLKAVLLEISWSKAGFEAHVKNTAITSNSAESFNSQILEYRGGRPKLKIGKDPSEAKDLHKAKRKYGPTKCGKCGELGHNKRCCEDRRNEQAGVPQETQLLNRKQRFAMENMLFHPIGVPHFYLR
ncbi:upf0061 protein mfla_1788 [Phtheirospermum japonicum]|uniref:Selenoprotein O n=1 Tax=Phtheirospermum japonicum TaxID=374723 RepID=A0A830B3E1_9LAMI|nr:upf0061 protein mfla_1788 [Phtheirospermum japonicum]